MSQQSKVIELAEYGGKLLEFPSTMSDEEISKVLREKIPKKTAPYGDSYTERAFQEWYQEVRKFAPDLPEDPDDIYIEHDWRKAFNDGFSPHNNIGRDGKLVIPASYKLVRAEADYSLGKVAVPPPPPGVGWRIADIGFGALETAISLVSGIGAFFGGAAAGVLSIPKQLMTKGTVNATDIMTDIDNVMKILMYQPKTYSGAMAMRLPMYPFKVVDSALVDAAKRFGWSEESINLGRLGAFVGVVVGPKALPRIKGSANRAAVDRFAKKVSEGKVTPEDIEVIKDVIDKEKEAFKEGTAELIKSLQEHELKKTQRIVSGRELKKMKNELRKYLSDYMDDPLEREVFISEMSPGEIAAAYEEMHGQVTFTDKLMKRRAREERKPSGTTQVIEDIHEFWKGDVNVKGEFSEAKVADALMRAEDGIKPYDGYMTTAMYMQGSTVLDNVLKGLKEEGKKVKAEDVVGQWKSAMKEKFPSIADEDLDYVFSVIKHRRSYTVDMIDALSKYGNPFKIVREPAGKDGTLNVFQVTSEALINMLSKVEHDITTPRVLGVKITPDLPKNIRIMDEMNGTDFGGIILAPLRHGLHLAKTTVDKIIKDLSGTRRALGLKFHEVEDATFYGIAKRLMAAGDEVALKVLDEQYKALRKKSLIEFGEEGKHKLLLELDDRQKTYYNKVRTYFNWIYDEINKARVMSGRDPIKFDTDYVTIEHAFDRALDEGHTFNIISMEAKQLHDLISKISKKAEFVRFPYLEKLKGVKHGYNLNIEDVMRKYATKALTDIYTSPVVEMLNNVLRNHTIVDWKGGKITIDGLAKRAPKFAAYLTDMTHYVAGLRPQTLRVHPQVERIVSKLTNNVAVAVLSASLRTGLTQSTAIVNTYTILGTRWTAKGIAGLFDGYMVRKALTEGIVKDRYPETALSETLREIVQTRKKSDTFRDTLNAMYGAFKEKTLIHIGAIDRVVATATWIGAYKKAKAAGMGEKAAIRYADNIVVDTQASTLATDLAPIQRTALGRSLATLQTWALYNWDMIVRDIAGITNPKLPKHIKLERFTRYVIGITLFNMLYEDILGVRSPFPTPLSAGARKLAEGEGTEDAVLAATRELIDLVPFVSGARYGSGIFGALGDTVQDGLAIVAQDKNWKLETVGSVVARIFGLPVAMMALRAYSRTEEGYEPMEAIFGPIGRRPGENETLISIIRDYKKYKEAMKREGKE